MPTTLRPPSPARPHHSDQTQLLKPALDAWLGRALEALVLTSVCMSPWVYGGAAPGIEFVLDLLLAAAVVCWAVRICVRNRIAWRMSALSVLMALLFLSGIFQLAPLPRGVLDLISPATGEMHDALIPAEPERLPDGSPGFAPQSKLTISSYPGGTRHELVRLLAVVLLVVLVENNLASPAAFRRLAICCTANGALLSLFGLVQFFTSPAGTIFWLHSNQGSVFGPFVNRNQFAFYVNLCFGLGLGLLLWRTTAESRDATRPDGFRRQLRRLAHDHRLLWLCLALVLMLAAVTFCLSRGGLAALCISGGLWLIVKPLRLGRLVRIGIPLGLVAASLALVAWFGLERVSSRLETLWTGEAFGPRMTIWSGAIKSVANYPLFGAGLGSFRYVEPLHRHDTENSRLVATHADNEYLEALVEGGILRLGLSLATIAVVVVGAYCGAFRSTDPQRAALAYGGLFGFTAALVQSATDFGLHLPAIAILAAVISAQLVSRDGIDQRQSSAGQTQHATGWFAPVGAAAVLIGLAGLVAWNGWIDNELSNARYSASQWARLDPGRQLKYLQAAVSFAPEDVDAQFALAKAELDYYQEVTQDAGAEVADMSPAARAGLIKPLGDLLASRVACPLLAQVHLWIALNAQRFEKAEPRTTYQQRAKLLAPADAEIWYMCGYQNILLDRNLALGLADWRQCLALSNRHLADILDRCAQLLTPQERLELLLPDRPAALLAAASHHYPTSDPNSRVQLEKTDREALCRRALELLPERGLTAQQWGERGEALAGLDRPAEAANALLRALAAEPHRYDWRLQRAAELAKASQLREARDELLIVLGQQPNSAEARSLLDFVSRKLAAGG